MIEVFQPLLDAVRGLDLTDRSAAETELRSRLDPEGPTAQAVRDGMLELLAEGKIADRGEMPVRWGRVTKATEETHDLSIDVVLMNGPGPLHRHPTGEVSFCIPTEGKPTFEGANSGWVVLPPDSTHVPEVTGGEMLIAYLLPGGEMEFLEAPGK